MRVEYHSSHRGWLREDIPCGSMILTALVSSTELPIRHQEVNVVTAYVVLSQVNDGHHKTLLSVVVRRFLRDIPDELRDLSPVMSESLRTSKYVVYLDFALQLALEATPDDFPLSRFETIGYRWNRSHIVGV